MSTQSTSFQSPNELLRVLVSFFILICSSHVVFAKGVEYQELQNPEWLRDTKKADTDIHIHYFWATWCAPCYHSTELFKRMAVKYPKEITIFAYSDETVF